MKKLRAKSFHQHLLLTEYLIHCQRKPNLSRLDNHD